MEQKTIDVIKILVNIFLLISILLLAWQFIKADKITKDIALSDSPTELINAYENITGQECVCGYNIINRIQSKDSFVFNLSI